MAALTALEEETARAEAIVAPVRAARRDGSLTREAWLDAWAELERMGLRTSTRLTFLLSSAEDEWLEAVGELPRGEAP